MVAEIKVCGGDYAPKMREYIEADVRKLAQVPGECQRFVILVVDTREPATPLGKWLMSYEPAHKARYQRTLSERVLVRIWEIQAAV
jgi:hypothetical protein